MNPLQRIMSQTLRYIQRHFAKMAALMLAVLVAVGSLLPYDAMPVLAAEDTEDYCHLSLELYPEGETAEKTVVLNGVMPKEASATAVDVTDDFIGREGGTDLSEENPHASLLAAYDITITDKSGEYQPDQDKPILVEISHPMLSEENDYEIWHIHDNGEKERISAFTVEDGLIRFTAAGFSVYAIVDVSPPYTTEEISGLADMQGSRATAGFCLYYGSHKYFTSSLNENAALIETGDPSAAAVWFFTKVGNYLYRL